MKEEQLRQMIREELLKEYAPSPEDRVRVALDFLVIELAHAIVVFNDLDDAVNELEPDQLAKIATLIRSTKVMKQNVELSLKAANRLSTSVSRQLG